LAFSTEPFVVDHIHPTVRGGGIELDNLALSCSGCNSHKYDKIEAVDPDSKSISPLYNPRIHQWQDNFMWSEDYLSLVGTTPVGRATIAELHLNRPNLVNLRRVLYFVGLHPPPRDPS
jgi:hypothetical protein